MQAVVRDWLAPGQTPIEVSRLSTRYGRVGFTLTAPTSSASVYAVHANVTLPATFSTHPPAGGIRLRIRAPLAHAGKLSKVTIGGEPWAAFSAAEETIDIAASKITPAMIKNGLANIVATFAGANAVPLRAARVDLSRRVVPVPPRLPAPYKGTAGPANTNAAPAHCPGGMSQVDSFTASGARWAACEDLQQPGGDIVLLSSSGKMERFSKSYELYRTNWTDDSDYYLGLTKQVVANASTDVLGAKLLKDEKALSWAAVEAAVPPIRESGKGGDWGSNCKGVRTFTGSRAAAVDTTFDDHGGDCNWEGWPSWESYAVNMHNKAVGDPQQNYNSTASADGNVGGVLPTVIFYLPMKDNGTSANRYWTYFTVPIADICPEPASILGYMRDLSFCYITCEAVVITVYWPSNPRHEIIYTTGQWMPRAGRAVPFPASPVLWPADETAVQDGCLAHVLELVLVQ